MAKTGYLCKGRMYQSQQAARAGESSGKIVLSPSGASESTEKGSNAKPQHPGTHLKLGAKYPIQNKWTRTSYRPSFSRLSNEMIFDMSLSDLDDDNNYDFYPQNGTSDDELDDGDQGQQQEIRDDIARDYLNYGRNFLSPHAVGYRKQELRRKEFRFAMKREARIQRDQKEIFKIARSTREQDVKGKNQRKLLPTRLDLLPTETLLNIIGHTRVSDLDHLGNSLTSAGRIIELRPERAYHTVLKTQFPHWMGVLGGTERRTDIQKEALISAMASIPIEVWNIVARANGYDDAIFIQTQIRSIHSDCFHLREYLEILDYLDSDLHRTIESLWPTISSKKRKADFVCLEQFGHRKFSHHYQMRDNRNLRESYSSHMNLQHYWSTTRKSIMLERIDIFKNQDKAVQKNVKCILVGLVQLVVNQLNLFDDRYADMVSEAYHVVAIPVDPSKMLSIVKDHATSIILSTGFSNPNGLMLLTRMADKDQAAQSYDDLCASMMKKSMLEIWRGSIRDVAQDRYLNYWKSSDMTDFIDTAAIRSDLVGLGSPMVRKFNKQQEDLDAWRRALIAQTNAKA